MPGWNASTRPGMTGKPVTRAIIASSCRVPCARRSGRRAWPSDRLPARPGVRLPLPSHAQCVRPRRRRPLPRGACPGLFGLARQPRLFPVGRHRFAFSAARRDGWIVLTRLGAEFVQEIFLCLLRRFLPVGEAWFPKATHRLSLVPFIVWSGLSLSGLAGASRCGQQRSRVREPCTSPPAPKPPKSRSTSPECSEKLVANRSVPHVQIGRM